MITEIPESLRAHGSYMTQRMFIVLSFVTHVSIHMFVNCKYFHGIIMLWLGI